MAPEILLIGAGITNAVTATLLQKTIPAANITLWDKARGIGGRMSRGISPKDSECAADLGAQYITTNEKTIAKNDCIYSPLIRNKIIEPLTANIKGMRKFGESTKHFVAPAGMNSIVKYFLRDIPKENIRFGAKVTSIWETEGKLNVIPDDDESGRCFDVVVSTMPIPQLMKLSGSVKDLTDAVPELHQIEYSSRFVLVLYFEKKDGGSFPGVDWACRYLDDKVFRYVSIDNVKRNREGDPVAVIFHTSVKFGLERVDSTLPDVEKILLDHAKQMFPEWPEPSATRCHRWRFSQVVKPFPGKPGCYLLSRTPTLILGGDAFSDSNFDGCIYSASKIVEAVNQIWTNN